VISLLVVYVTGEISIGNLCSIAVNKVTCSR